jgi:hypothetical protein
VVFVIVLLALICLLLLVLLIKQRSQLEKNDILIKAQEEQIQREQSNYLALEQGMDEQEENYEAMMLSLQDAYSKNLLEAEAEINRHRSECLPIVSDIRTLGMTESS